MALLKPGEIRLEDYRLDHTTGKGQSGGSSLRLVQWNIERGYGHFCLSRAR